MGQQHFGFGRQRQFAMASAIGLAFGQHLAFGIKDFQAHIAQGIATGQGLGEHIDTVLVAPCGQADIAQGEQRSRL